ncbi:hypothetical protein GPL15_20410 [Clostridium sp. MCC353]|uniref:hypothetical protein n=1 Tax=Clostridium sp. MCC353 TaxID=2592646 RepID=UPI001C0213ED|nr:hypothetical protein [Clostridium sp. MCC353]MBT9778846.1 hypothetical protein [Clostridium sp. MCC353]
MAAITVKNRSQLDKMLDVKIRTALEHTQRIIDSSSPNDLFSDPDLLKPASSPAGRSTASQAGREYGLLNDGQNIHINDGGSQDLADLAIRDLGGEAGIAALLKENLAKAGIIIK